MAVSLAESLATPLHLPHPSVVLRIALALPKPLSHKSLPGEGGIRFLGQALCEHQFHPACGQQGRGCEPPVYRRGSDGGACALSCVTDLGAEPRFHPPPALLATVTLHPHTSKSPRICVSGRSGTGALRRQGPGPSPVLGARGADSARVHIYAQGLARRRPAGQS